MPLVSNLLWRQGMVGTARVAILAGNWPSSPGATPAACAAISPCAAWGRTFFPSCATSAPRPSKAQPGPPDPRPARAHRPPPGQPRPDPGTKPFPGRNQPEIPAPALVKKKQRTSYFYELVAPKPFSLPSRQRTERDKSSEHTACRGLQVFLAQVSLSLSTVATKEIRMPNKTIKKRCLHHARHIAAQLSGLLRQHDDHNTEPRSFRPQRLSLRERLQRGPAHGARAPGPDDRAASPCPSAAGSRCPTTTPR